MKKIKEDLVESIKDYLEITEKLRAIPKKELPRIWTSLLFDDVKCKELEMLSTDEKVRDWQDAYISLWIEVVCKKKELYRYLNVSTGHMTPLEFELFWLGFDVKKTRKKLPKWF